MAGEVMSMLEIDEYGITGSSGLFPGGHLAMPYSATPRHVFVAVQHKEYGLVWRRCTPNQAKRWRKKPIGCGIQGCGRPAVVLDHYWPWMGDEYNRCAKHYRDDRCPAKRAARRGRG
jgi:hypothetical protein